MDICVKNVTVGVCFIRNKVSFVNMVEYILAIIKEKDV
jgi:hypothetical protein